MPPESSYTHLYAMAPVPRLILINVNSIKLLKLMVVLTLQHKSLSDSWACLLH